MALASRHQLWPFVDQGRLELRLPDAAPADPPLVLPAAAVRLLVDVLTALADGTAATVVVTRDDVHDESDDIGIGLTGTALAAAVWPADDFADWETAGE